MNLRLQNHPVDGSHLLAVLNRVGSLQRLARPRRSDPPDPAWWRKWAMHTCNELLAAAPGVHIDRQVETHVTGRPFDRTTTTTTRARRITWPTPCAATVLCYGCNALFATIDEAPAEILAAVRAGVAEALARGRRVRYSGDDIARALGITAAEKIAARAWQIGAVDVTLAEWSEIIRKRRAEQQRRYRREQGSTPRDESVATMARAIGVKPNSLQKRLRRARLKAEKTVAQNVLFSKPPNNKEIGKASKKGHEKTSQLRQPPGRPKDRAGEGVGRNLKKTIAADASKIFSERYKSRRPDRVASPTLSTAADSALASTPLAEVRQ